MRMSLLFMAVLLAACGGGGGTATIAEVQGTGVTSPLLGQPVAVTGLVTGDFQDGDSDTTNSLGGFFLQQVPPDSDSSTSDGVFVFDGNNPATNVNAGDKVTVEGVVKEHFGETQISASSVRVTGAGSVIPATVNLPTSATVTNADGIPVADLERYEGMLVRFPQSLSVTATHELERFGNVQLSEGGRLYQFTNGSAPDGPGYAAHQRTVGSRSIQLDDGRRAENITPVRLLNAGAAPGYSLRAGDVISGVAGNLRFSRGSGGSGAEGWRLMPTSNPSFEALNPRPGAPVVSGSLRVASFNVLNFFTTIDTGASICGPDSASGCRGADSQQEYDRQLTKTVTALRMMDADIVGLVELENNATASLQALVDGLNAAMGAGTYAYVDTGAIGDSPIKTGFIYKPGTVSTDGEFRVLDDSVDPDFGDRLNRPALAQTFSQVVDGAALTIAVNHLKSKGSNCDANNDPNTGDGQGNCAATRTAAARSLANWLASDPGGSADPDVLVIGDLNAYLFEDPLEALRSAGYADLVATAGASNAYSFVFDGQAGALDHALASASLAPQVAEILEWHINADEPALHDYNLTQTRDPALFDPSTPYRAADHDPVIIGLDLVP